MVNRTTVSGSSTPPLTPSAFFNEYAERIDTLFDASALPLTAVGGTGNAVTATLDPPLASAGVFVDGMKFTLTWAAQNTAGVTLQINGGAAIPVLNRQGQALDVAALVPGLRSMIEYIGGAFRILTDVADGTAQQRFWTFTASGTWLKPGGLEDDQIINVECWAGGGGGGSGGGGGGGGYSMRRVRAADMPGSVTVTIGAGGAVGGSGGNTSFGALVTAFGGRVGGAGAGGGGGGEVSQGGAGGGAAPAPGSGSGAGGSVGGGAGGNGVSGTLSTGQAGDDARTIGGGGGGGGSGTGAGGAGGNAVMGGAGGGASPNGAGGQSVRGGNGGASGSAGSAPGGGGGRNAAGARGEVRIWI